MKQFPLVVIGLLVFSLWFHPRVHRASYAPSAELNARSWWQMREFGTVGYTAVETTLPLDSVIVMQFPQLKNYHYSLITRYRAKGTESLDLITDRSTADSITTSLPPQPGYTVAVYSGDEAKKANGYYYEQKDLSNQVWISLTTTNTLQ